MLFNHSTTTNNKNLSTFTIRRGNKKILPSPDEPSKSSNSEDDNVAYVDEFSMKAHSSNSVTACETSTKSEVGSERPFQAQHLITTDDNTALTRPHPSLAVSSTCLAAIAVAAPLRSSCSGPEHEVQAPNCQSDSDFLLTPNKFLDQSTEASELIQEDKCCYFATTSSSTEPPKSSSIACSSTVVNRPLSEHSRNRSPSTPLGSCLKSPSKVPRPALKSSLRFPAGASSPKVLSNHIGRPSTERRVRGLWNETRNLDCHLNKLRDETLVHAVGFLNLADLLRIGMVAQRYRSIVKSNTSLWNRVDATEFVHTAHARSLDRGSSIIAAQEQTGSALDHVLRQHRPQSLTIRNIFDRLSADSYLPSLASLKELSLSHFDNLTDTHTHVLLLMAQSCHQVAAAKKKGNTLRKLQLEFCPKLTNACVRSIASQCRRLESLNLNGCTNITNLEPLAPLLVTESKSWLPVKANPIAPAAPSLMSMFGAYPAATDAPQSILSIFGAPSLPQSVAATTVPNSPPQSPPRPTTPTQASTLQSLFAPPGMSPPRKIAHQVPSLASLMASSLILPSATPAPMISLAMNVAGNLHSLDLQGTGLSPDAILTLLKTAGKDDQYQTTLKSFRVDGTAWTDRHLESLTSLLAWNELIELVFANDGEITTRGAGQLSDSAWSIWATQARCSRLTTLELPRQAHLTGNGLATILQQTPKLERLCVRRCPRLFGDSPGSSTLPLLKRLKKLRISKAPTLKAVDIRDCTILPEMANQLRSILQDQDSIVINRSNSLSNTRFVQLLL